MPELERYRAAIRKERTWYILVLILVVASLGAGWISAASLADYRGHINAEERERTDSETARADEAVEALRDVINQYEERTGEEPQTVSPESLSDPAPEVDTSADPVVTPQNGRDGRNGRDGKDATPAMVQAALAAYCAANRCTVDAGMVAAAVAAFCADGACVGAAGTNGINGLNGVAGTNGADGAPGVDGKDGRGIQTIECVQPDPASAATVFRFTFTDTTFQDIPGTCTVPPETPAPTEVAP